MVKCAKQAKQSQGGVKHSYRIMVLLTLLGLMIWGIKVVSQMTIFPIKKVIIKGDYTLADQEHLQQLLLPYVSKGFFAVSVSTIKQQLEHENWISTSHVSRNWPDKLIIVVQQQQAIAHWNRTALIAQNNTVFYRHGRESDYDQLPFLSGPDEQRNLIVSTYFSLQTLLQPVNLTVSALYLDKQDNWCVKLSNGIHLVMGKNQSIEVLEKFMQTYQQKFSQKAEAIDYIDLRYENGVAVRWKKHLG